ncbi:MAG: hypothetical protein IPP91_11340 [Betaproteobacteria bacterium]|nr:hypothetical protein [Betaproteobacteria bacterium]
MAKDRVIPSVIINLPRDPSGQAPPTTLNAAAQASTQAQLITAGRDSYIPITYGGPDRVAGLLYFCRVHNGNLVVVQILGHGPMESITGVDMDDGALPASVTVATYLGTDTQNEDPTLVAAIPGFAEKMRGTAYLVAVVPPGVSRGFPRFTALVKGVKVYDPRENVITYSNTFSNAAWTNSLSTLTQGALAPDGTPTAWTLTDSNAAGYGALSRNFAIANDTASYAMSIRVKKTAGGTAPTFGINVNLVGGTGVTRHLRLNTDTGVDAFGNWTVTTDLRDPTFWLCAAVVTNNASGNTNLAYALYPATSAYGGGASDTVAATGSAVCCWAQGNNGATILPYTPTTSAIVLPGTRWSDNPALALADFAVNTVYGCRKLADWTQVAYAAAYCDELVGATPEKRNLLSLTILEKRTTDEWVDVLRAYVPAFVEWDGDIMYMTHDGPRPSDHAFTAANIDTSPEPALINRGLQDRANVVEIGFMRTDVTPWVMDFATADNAPSVRYKSRVDLPGIRRATQAYRFAVERLNHYTLERLEAIFGAFEQALKVRVGDVATVTDDIGMSGQLIRVTARTDRGHGRWLVGGRFYSAAAFSDSIATGAAGNATNLPNPRIVPAPASITVTETVYAEKEVTADALGRGFIYQSRLDVTWPAVSHPYKVKYRVQFLDGAQVIHEGTTPDLSYSSPAVQQGITYTVKVWAFNNLGFECDTPVSTNHAALGKLLPPGNVPAITQAVEIGGDVLLSWSPAIDIDVVRYEWRYASPGAFVWSSATLIDRPDGLRAVFKGLPVGTWRLGVKAIDSVGNYSATETTVDLTITTDANSFAQEREFTSPTLTNMVAIPPLEGVNKSRWATRIAADQWNSVMPNPVNSGGNPVISYHASGDQKWLGETWDLANTIAGDWSLIPYVSVLSGSAIYSIETSPDGSTWTPHTGTAWNGSTRFIRPVIQALGTSTIVVYQPPKIAFIATIKKSSGGPVTSLASGGKTIVLPDHYAQLATKITPLGTTARMATVDNVVINGTDSRIAVPCYAGTLYAIRPADSTVSISALATTTGATSACYCPSNGKLYVACYGAITVVDPITRAVSSTITPSGAVSFCDIAYCPTNDRLYCVDQGANRVTVIDPSNNSVITNIGTTTGGQGIAYCASNDRLYVSMRAAGTVKVIDPTNNTVATTIASGLADAYGIIYVAQRDRVYVCNLTGTGTVIAIKPSDNTVEATCTGLTYPSHLAYCPINDRLYVTKWDSAAGGLHKVNPATMATDGSIIALTGGYSSLSVAFSPQGNTMWVSDYGAGKLTPVPVATGTPGTAITVGTTPFWVKEFTLKDNSFDVYLFDQAGTQVASSFEWAAEGF